MNSLLKRLDKFLFHYNSVRPFAFLRISTALFCLIYFACFASEMHDFIGLNGYVGRELSEATINSKIIPRISWVINPLIKAGYSDDTSVSIVMWIYLAAMICMLAGFCTRVAVFIIWAIHLMIYHSTGMLSYGADAFTNLILFYCLIMPPSRSYSLDAALFKTKKKESNFVYESFFVRVLQIHMCIAYFFGGIGKLIMPGWLSGNKMWQALMVPYLNNIDFSFLAHHSFILILLGCIIVTLELLYPVMMCYGKIRKLWLVSIILMHIFIGYFMSLPFFALIMIIFNMAAFGWNEFYPFLSKLFKRCTLLLQPVFNRSNNLSE
jgi:hypothetical protein